MSEPIPSERQDRPLHMHEVRVLIDSLKTQGNVHLTTRDDARRQRTIGWLVLVGLILLVGAGSLYTYVSTEDFKDRLHESCETRNQQTLATRDFYKDALRLNRETPVRGATPEQQRQIDVAREESIAVLERAIETLVPIDCAEVSD